MKVYVVDAAWDAEAGVWVAHSDDIPGLTTEAETLEALVKRVTAVTPELLELNKAGPSDGAEIHFRAECRATLANAA